MLPAYTDIKKPDLDQLCEIFYQDCLEADYELSLIKNSSMTPWFEVPPLASNDFNLKYGLSGASLFIDDIARLPDPLAVKITNIESEAFEGELFLANCQIIRKSIGCRISEFRLLLNSVTGNISGESMDIRDGYARTSPDEHGRVFTYLCPTKIEDELSTAYELLLKHPPSLIGAAIAFTYLVALHPYRDFNGRLSRLVANSLIAPACVSSPHVYVQIKRIQLMSGNFFSVHVRRASLLGDWLPIIKTFRSSIKIFFLISKGGESHA
ncbi:Fic family protein [Xanthomonas hyacinthi]|nr:Fic family protein [Xanthomonas hyacinthi]